MRLLLASTVVVGALSQPQWQYERRNIATIALGIDCPTDRSCYLGASQDGVGNVILVTHDGGASYHRANLGPGGRPPLQMMLLSTAAQSDTSAITSGMGFGNNAVYSEDGENFDSGEDFTLIGVSQNIKEIPGVRGGYAMAGDFIPQGHDLAVTVDGGNTWETLELPDGVLGAWSRYAHYVDARTWYVAGGQWPRRPNFKESEHFDYSESIRLDRHTHTFEYANVTAPAPAQDGYIAAVARTTDGGATWQRVYYNANEGFYFNEIDCPSRSVCFVTGEGQGTGRILRTTNGGDSWDTIWRSTPGFSYELMGMHFFDEREGWACGMKITPPFSFETLFLHTTDGGNTWTEQLVGQAFCTGMSFHGNRRDFAHATAIEPLMGVSSTLVYRA